MRCHIKPFICKKCSIHLGELSGRMRKGAILLCAACWKQAELAISICDMKQSKSPFPDFKDSGGAVDDLMSIFGMKK